MNINIEHGNFELIIAHFFYRWTYLKSMFLVNTLVDSIDSRNFVVDHLKDETLS